MTEKNFTTKNVIFESSWLQGTINVSYDTLVKVFGRQNAKNDGYKTDAEWEIKFNDGTYATIYNWKNGKNYLGKEGYRIKDITNWHIGGQTGKSVVCVQQAIDDYLKEVS